MEGSGFRRLAVIVAAFFIGILIIQIYLSPTAVGADGFIRYVDGGSGFDQGSCRTAAAPCKTITYALKRTVDEDTIRVAQGIYVENLAVSKTVKLEGGYEASGWTRDIKKYETIIDGSDDQVQIGDWDGRVSVRAVVIKESEQYKLWYDGTDIIGTTQNVGTAVSTDGKVWIKSNQNPVLSGDSGSWDEFGDHKPFVMKDGGLYKMWYQGTEDGTTRLGYATSTDGLIWTKYSGNPVLKPGPDDYDRDRAGSGSILFEDGIYKLWYQANGDLGGVIAYATSADGISWNKVGLALAPSESSWDKNSLWGPSVLKLGEVYWMWYSAATDNGCAIGAVTSSDGVTWKRFRDEPVLADPDSLCTGHPSVINENGTLKMWYEGYSGDPWRGYTDYSESTDGINWTKYVGNPVLLPGALGQEGTPVVVFDNVGKGATLDGFTIRNGFADSGAGVDIRRSEEVTVKDNLIMNNLAIYTVEESALLKCPVSSRLAT